jgi:hypothetical protein
VKAVNANSVFTSLQTYRTSNRTWRGYALLGQSRVRENQDDREYEIGGEAEFPPISAIRGNSGWATKAHRFSVYIESKKRALDDARECDCSGNERSKPRRS